MNLTLSCMNKEGTACGLMTCPVKGDTVSFLDAKTCYAYAAPSICTSALVTAVPICCEGRTDSYYGDCGEAQLHNRMLQAHVHALCKHWHRFCPNWPHRRTHPQSQKALLQLRRLQHPHHQRSQCHQSLLVLHPRSRPHQTWS